MPASYHQKIERALTEAGFIVRRLEKHRFRHLWIISMYPGTAQGGQSVAGVAKHIRRMIASLSRSVPNMAISVMFYAERIKVAFAWPHGKPGIWAPTQRHIADKKSAREKARLRFRHDKVATTKAII